MNGSTLTNLVEAPLSLHRLDDESKAALFTEAKTAYKFAPTPVTDAELTAIWDLAKWPPTSANFQPMRVIYVQSPEGRERLVANMNDNNKERVASAPATAVLAYDNHWHKNIPTTTPHLAGYVSHFDENEAGKLETAKSQAWVQAGYFILATRALGLAAGPMAGMNYEAVNSDLFPDGDWSAFMVVNIGHPTDGSYRDRMPRLEQEVTVRFA